ncbi:phage holin [Liquorilactobacillus hordei]|uniref:phage holin n=1 Tax=Liquorilactobacillus hordei TaxID=468911 RepID=UPI0039EBAD33
MQNVTDLIVSIVAVVVPIVAGFVTKNILASKKTLNLISVLSPLAKEAVVAAEKSGVTAYLTSEIKKSKAVQYVSDELKKLGFTVSDTSTIANSVEKAFAEMKTDIEKAYPQKTEEQEKAEELAKTNSDKANELLAAQKALADAQAKVAELSK